MEFKPSGEEHKWAKLMEQNQKKDLSEKFSHKKRIKMTRNQFRTCPKDLNKLIQRKLDADVIIEICPICSGIWIDRLNLEKLFHHIEKKENFLKFLSRCLSIEISEIN